MVPEAIHDDLEQGRRPALHKPLTLAFELSDVREPILWAPRAPTREVADAWQPNTYDPLVWHDRRLLLV